MRVFPRYSIFALAAGLATSTILPKQQGPANLSITIEALGNTEVKAIITNVGAKTLRLLKEGTILDNAPVQKFQVSKHEKDDRIAFEGIKKSIKYTNLSSSAFTSLDAGKTIEIKVDIATVHDVTMGGLFHILSQGRIPIADHDTNSIGSSVSFVSNNLQMKVDGAQARRTRKAFILKHKRDTSAPQLLDCKDKQFDTVKNSLQNCAVLATWAAEKATTGPAAKFEEYFGTSDRRTRKLIHDRFAAVGQECLVAATAGKLDVTCNDRYKYCTESTLAFTISPLNMVTYCPSYWDIPSLSNACHGQDQTLTTIHEFTHAEVIFKPGTEDRAYGYENDMTLTPAEKAKNADNHGQYINALWTGC